MEDTEWITWVGHPPAPHVERVSEAAKRVMASVGAHDPEFGRKLPWRLRDAGLLDVGVEGRCHGMDAGGPGRVFMARSTESLRPLLLAHSDIADEDVEATLREIADPDNTFLSWPQVSAWGRKPEDA